MGQVLGILFSVIFGICVVAVGVGGMYIVDEGNIGVITKWGKAVDQEGPDGLKFKMPIVTGIREFDVRERKSSYELAAATENQLPISAKLNVNWRLDPTRVLEIFKNYGTPEQFESNILSSRIINAAKGGISEFQASDMIRERAAVSEAIYKNLLDVLANYPATVMSVQIENIDLPDKYLSAVMDKERAREGAAKEQYNLQRQKLESQQKVQTAEAERDAAKAKADGEAYRITQTAKAQADATRLAGEAEADAVQAVNAAISGNPLIIDYERAKRWNGQMPSTMLGGKEGVLMQLPSMAARN